MILATVLTSAGVPLAGLSLIIGLDQILERVRCVMNVSGDLVACVVMDRYVDEGRPHQAEVALEAALQETRLREGHDVLIQDKAPHPDPTP
jgi:Na+/H+-dicarboxylate symporter